MNWWIDILIILLVIGAVVLGYKGGMLQTLDHLIKLMLSIFISQIIYPIFGGMIKNYTSVFKALKENIQLSLNLERIAAYEDLGIQRTFIQQMDLPNYLKKQLLYNNNSEIYSLFQAKDLTDYIYGYLANSILNMVILLVCFLVIFITAYLILEHFQLSLSRRLKIRKHKLSKYLSAGVGGFIGILHIQIFMLLLFFFYSIPQGQEVLGLIQKTFIGQFLFTHNIFIQYIIKIIV